jgi:HEPN domain-containing protein
MKRLTAEWVRKAEADFLAAARLAARSARGPALNDAVCFHCQQSAEKYLKALLEENGIAVPRTHNLVALLPLLVPHHAALRRLRRGCDFLTRFAVDTRYPGESASKRQAASAQRWTTEVRDACRSILGLRIRRRRTP